MAQSASFEISGPGIVLGSEGVGTSAPQSALHVVGAAADAGAGTISSSGSAVTGVGTAFTTQLHVGDLLVVGSQIQGIASIASDTSLTTQGAFSPTANNSSFQILRPVSRFDTFGATPVASYIDGAGNATLGAGLDVTGNVGVGGNLTAGGRVAIGVYTLNAVPSAAAGLCSASSSCTSGCCTFDLPCKGSDIVIGGGAYINNTYGNALRESRPNGNAWRVTCIGAPGGNGTPLIDLICTTAFVTCLSHGS
jgi:hypothetical protein